MNSSSIRLTHIALSSLALCGLLQLGCGGTAVTQEGSVGSDPEALSEDKCPDNVPAALTPAADQRLWFFLEGDGVQIYDCTATATGSAWVFRAPEANLLDSDGNVVGFHYANAGPWWQFEDGSSVHAAKKVGATVDPTAIPWLLLAAVGHGDVDGKMTNVTTIQRLSTTGGLAPAGSCNVGDVARVPYTAQYVFYKTASGSDNPQCGG